MKRSLLLLLPFALAACSSSSDLATTPSSAADVAARKDGPGGRGKGQEQDVDETVLVSDIPKYHGNILDPDLVNPWGLAFGPTGILWVSNNASGTSTLYNEAGVRQSLVVNVPAAAGEAGAPTGIVFNGTPDFVIPGSTAAHFIFAGEDGSITAWVSGTNASVVADRSSLNAVYKSIALASHGGANFLYLTNFKQHTIDVFDASYHFVSSFTDATIPAGFAPFGIHTIGGKLWVTFAKQKGPDNEDDQAGPGNGFVDIFNTDGTLFKRFASHGSLNSPWAVVMAPMGFGDAAGTVLVGNFGDGRIGSYDATSGEFLGFVNGKDHKAIEIEGLWDLTFGPGAGVNTLFFSAGPDDESHGQLGTLTVRPGNQGQGRGGSE